MGRGVDDCPSDVRGEDVRMDCGLDVVLTKQTGQGRRLDGMGWDGMGELYSCTQYWDIA